MLRKAYWFLLMVAVGTALGCVSSTQQVIEMRAADSKADANDNCSRLVKCFDRENHPSDPRGLLQKAAWRIEALRTMHALARKWGYATSEPALNDQVLAITRREYRNPGTARNRDKLKAWAVSLLANARPRQPASYFVNVLIETADESDPDGVVSLAALSALSSRLDAVSADVGLKRQVLYRLAQLSAELHGGHIGSPRRDELALAVHSCQQRLRSYEAVVDLLVAVGWENETHTLLEVLTWNYQHLKVGDHREGGEEVGGLFEQNTDTLLELSWHQSERVRERARLLLGEFAPGRLFQALIDRLGGEGDTAPEDCRQLVALLVVARADTGKDSQAAPYLRRKGEALDVVFATIGAIALDQREVIHARLLLNFPADLADRLTAASRGRLGESEKYALQHLRYLEHARDAVGKDSDRQAAIDDAESLFMAHPSLAVKKQVAAALSVRNPVLMARSCVPVMASLSDESSRSAEYVVEAYMDALERIRVSNTLQQIDRSIGTGSVYQVLSHGMARPELDIKRKIARFLLARDCDLAIGVLADDIRRRFKGRHEIAFREWCLLGDMLREKRKALTAASMTSGQQVLALGLGEANPEHRLLCARYLLELGVDPKQVKGADPEIRAMVEMAREQKDKTKPKLRGEEHTPSR